MKSKNVRQTFLDFFKDKKHHIVSSASMVIKDDSSLMFTNAGMNQFKDIFLENQKSQHLRIANSQKCLRVSGKHNDLEEVGHDTYHHTMFEMLGNWSFGDYFKKEIVDWAWEFLTRKMKIPKENLYATIFEGSPEVARDEEAYKFWKRYLPGEKIIEGDKKDNFWEMGDTGPCGPCSEIHVDLRTDKEKANVAGKDLINKDHPLVIEIWNLVFIQYNRKSDGTLETLAKKYVDTGLGFERLCMVMQGKTSNYDTDLFQPIIQQIEQLSGLEYDAGNKKVDTAMRVVADHIRTISFSITDGQLPSNNKAGYVIRRVLRRAVRYGYTFLNFRNPFLFKLISVLCDVLGEHYSELIKNRQLIETIVKEEEFAFLRTLEHGIGLLDEIITKNKKTNHKIISGETAFELYDTYGFPVDLTVLIAQENGLTVNIPEFHSELEKQKTRSRRSAEINADDWIKTGIQATPEFVGYDLLTSGVQILQYRKVKSQKGELFQFVFDQTPFYGESGGQVGDTGFISSDREKIRILNTQKEHGLTVHIAKELPADLKATFTATVDENKRKLIVSNHSATHLMHHVLRKVLGGHVEQKGSLVNDKHLTFDFSHFQQVEKAEIAKIEQMVNAMIRQNISLSEFRNIPKEKALEMGALALFGEKYGDSVRVVKFGDSVELCGGTHVQATGQIGFFKIINENSIATGIRRIEAVTAQEAESIIALQTNIVHDLSERLKLNEKKLVLGVENLLAENKKLKKEIERANKQQLRQLKVELRNKIIEHKDFLLIAEKVQLNRASEAKDLAFQLKGEIPRLVLILGSAENDTAQLTLMIDSELIKKYGLNAGKIIREAAKEIDGGGGGQAFFASAGGKNPGGLDNAMQKAMKLIRDRIKT